MHPEHEPPLQAAFAELQRRYRGQAPPFGPMRERALREADTRRPSARCVHVARRIAWSAAAACAVAMALWRLERLPQTTPPQPAPGDSNARIEQLIASIEQSLEFNPAFSSFEYPSDILLSEKPTDLSR